MKAIEIVVLVFAVALVVFTIAFNLIRRHRAKKKGGSSCCGGCTSCPYSGMCANEGKEEVSENKDA